MSPEPDEIEVGLDDITPKPENLKRLDEKLLSLRAVVSHAIAIILVLALVMSVVLHVWVLSGHPEQEDSLSKVFEKWYSVISPFAGLALGAYYGSSKNRKL